MTHDQEEALTMSDRIAVMNGGQLEQIGPAEDLYEHPDTKFVATFLGETNLFEGRLGSDGTVVDGDDLNVTVAPIPELGGEEVTVSIRPEEVYIVGSNETLETENEWTGTIKNAIYKGSIMYYHVDLGPRSLEIERQVNDDTKDFIEGEHVTVGFPSRACEVVTK